MTWQPRSSEPSPQSSWPLQSSASATQRPLLHRNCEEALHLCSVEGRGGRSAASQAVRGKGEKGTTHKAHLSWCSVDSWEPRHSGRGSHSHRHTPTGGSSDSARWHSGTHWGHRSGTLGGEGAVRLVPQQSPSTSHHSPRLTTLRGLVRAISTVTVMVTHKVLGDALAVLAHELTVITGTVVYWGQRWRAPQSCSIPSFCPTIS